MTKKQCKLMEDLTFWHAMHIMAQDALGQESAGESAGNWHRTPYSLCDIAAAIGRGDQFTESWYGDIDRCPITARCMRRAMGRRPRGCTKYTFWWPVKSWAPRIAFIDRMIADTEQRLKQL